jgi:hypothetical protein
MLRSNNIVQGISIGFFAEEDRVEFAAVIQQAGDRQQAGDAIGLLVASIRGAFRIGEHRRSHDRITPGSTHRLSGLLFAKASLATSPPCGPVRSQ